MEKLIQWNCNGLKLHYPEIKKIIVEDSPFCLCIQESHLKSEETFNLRGYKSYRLDITPNVRACGGVVTFIKSNISSQEVQLITDLQAVAVKISYPYQITICNLYLPNNNWNLQCLRELVQQLTTPFLLLGDLNSHNTIWGSEKVDAAGRRVEQLLDEFDLVLLNTGEGTYINSRSNSLSAIDLSISSPCLAPLVEWNVSINNTDHLPICIKFAERFTSNDTYKKWKLLKANWPKYQSILSSETQLINPDNTNVTEVNDITKLILHAAQQSIPKTRGTETSIKKVPWWNTEIENSIKDKKKAFNTFKKYPTQENMIQFKKLRAKARQLIVQGKKQSWQSYVQSINSDTSISDVWQKMRNIIGKKFPIRPNNLVIEGISTTDSEEIAEHFATHFERVSSSNNYSDTFKTIKNNINTYIDFSTEENLSYNSPFSRHEFEEALSQADNSAAGPDEIPYEMIRQLPENMKTELLQIYNKIWTTATYPTEWKTSITIPIAKPGKDIQLANNYRPISLTCCMGKILEKMVSQRLIWSLEAKGLLSNSQMGFRKNRSTIDQLMYLENAIQKSFAKREHLVAIFFDLEKAYDTTWRYGIMKRLFDWDFKGNLPKFINSFLENRTFKVRLGQTFSSLHQLENGIPQGSTLSVILFLVAVNGIDQIIPANIGRSLYVDDLTIFYSGQTMDEIVDNLQQAVNDITSYAENNGFKFSSTKTHCVHYCRLRNPHNDPRIFLYNTEIEVKDYTRYLGLEFDSKLYWKNHIQSLADSCKKKINIMRSVANLNWGCDRNVLLMLYKSLILSKIDYACTVYSSARQSKLKVLDSIQGTALRIAMGAYRTSPYLSLCCEAGIVPLKYRRLHFLTKYGTNIAAQQQHPLYPCMFPLTDADPIFENRPTITQPATYRLQNYMLEINESFPNTYPLVMYEIPPWEITPPIVHLECLRFQKKDSPKEIITNEMRSILNKYTGSYFIYTDGSKTDNGTGSAFSSEYGNFNWTLPSSASVYTAELYAIWQALKFIDIENIKNAVILSDSLSSLQAISNVFSKNTLVNNILTTLHFLKSTEQNVIFVWIPSHIGINGNELADTSAREAANCDEIQDIPILIEDSQHFLKNKIYQKWEREWQTSISKLRLIKLQTRKLIYPTRLNKRDEVVLTRLRIGHTRLTSEYLLLGTNRPVCEICEQYISVEHIILQCNKYNNIRNSLNLPVNLKLCLTVPCYITKTIKYLKEIDLYKKI